MRELGVVSAKWGTDGTLLECVLGPEVIPPEQPKSETEAAEWASEQARKLQEEIDRLDFGSSGG